MIRSSVIALSLLVLMEVHSANFRYEERNTDLAVSVTKEKTNGTVSITLFNNGKTIEIDSNNDDISNGYVLDNGKQIFVNKSDKGQRFSIDDGPSRYVFFVDKDGNIDISSEDQNVDTGNMSFAFRTDGMIKSSNPILFNSLFLYGNRIQNDSILKTRKYTFYYKTFDNYGIFDSRAKEIEPKQFASSSAILLERLKRLKAESSSPTSSANAPMTSSTTSVASSLAKNTKNNYGIMLNDYVGYSGSALQVNSYGLMECDSMHFGGTDSELSVKKGKFLVHGAISGTFKSTESIKVEEVADVYVHQVNMRFIEGLHQTQQLPQSLEFITTLERMGLFKVHNEYSNNAITTIERSSKAIYSHLWQWEFKDALNIGIGQDLLLGAGLDQREIKRRKWHCMDEGVMNEQDYKAISQFADFAIELCGEKITLRQISTSGEGDSCGFRSLIVDRNAVYARDSEKDDTCRKQIVELLKRAIDEENEEVKNLVSVAASQTNFIDGMKRVKTTGKDERWDTIRKEIFSDSEFILSLKLSKDNINEILTYNIDQIEDWVMSSCILKKKVRNLIPIEVLKFYENSERLKKYIDDILAKSTTRLEVNPLLENPLSAENPLLRAIAHVQNASLVIVLWGEQEYPTKTYKTGDILFEYDNPHAERVIYATFAGAHYSKAVTQEQYDKAVSEYNK